MPDAAATAAPRDPTEALRPRRPRRRLPLTFTAALPGQAFSDVLGERPLGGRVRAVRRLAFAALWTALALPVQAALVLLPGRGKIAFARAYWAVLRRIIGLRVQVVGEAARGGRVLFVANHTSWLDILALGGTLEAAFVAKAEVAGWPVIGTVARLGRSVFVSRARGRTGSEADAIRARLAEGGSLVLFPEGTTGDGTRVLPFRSSFLATAGAASLVQPVSVVYDRLGGLPACRRDRPLFAWYGDMDIGSHAWRLARRAGTRATILLHEPVAPADFPDRKALSRAAEAAVAEGAGLLRQNRPVEPLRLARPVPPARPVVPTGVAVA